MVTLANPNMIIRYIRFRKGYNSGCLAGAQCGANLQLSVRSQNMMIDHVSTSWNQDDGINPWGVVSDITIQNSLIAEGLYPHATAIIVGGNSPTNLANIDVHHNLIMNGTHRAPQLNSGSSREVNDIKYNIKWNKTQLLGGIQYDGINNKFKSGPYSLSQYTEFVGMTPSSVAESLSGSPSMYLSGNVGPNQSNPAGDQWVMAKETTVLNAAGTSAIPTGWRRSTPLTAQTYPITAVSTTTLESTLLPDVGASKRLDCYGNWVDARDAVDTRLVNQYNTNTGNSTDITTETQVGGYPTIASGTACSDKDKDGIPDVWEEARGYNPNSPANRNTVLADGYTLLEHYLNGQ
jgi:hypothetical protein